MRPTTTSIIFTSNTTTVITNFSLTTTEDNCCVHYWSPKMAKKIPGEFYDFPSVLKFPFHFSNCSHHNFHQPPTSSNINIPGTISIRPNNTTTTPISNFLIFPFTTTEFKILVNCCVHRWISAESPLNLRWISAESPLKSQNFYYFLKLLSLWFPPTFYFLHTTPIFNFLISPSPPPNSRVWLIVVCTAESPLNTNMMLHL